MLASIKTAIENKEKLILYEHAKNGNFLKDSRDRLKFYSGGYSVVYPYVCSQGKKWAFRCWYTKVDTADAQYRAEAISKAIRSLGLKFLCDFDYVERGILVSGKVHPITRMRWVEGDKIKDYICKHRNSKERLEKLAKNFLDMTRVLHQHHLAHGDLQHGNILVDASEELYLVDYDSFYVPELRGKPSLIAGLPPYQHPARPQCQVMTEKVDYFSELIIYLSIVAIAEKASLVEDYKVEAADNLLFTKEDYANLKSSAIYKELQTLSSKVRQLLKVLEYYLSCKSIDDLMPFEEHLVSHSISFSASDSPIKRHTQTLELKWEVAGNCKVRLTKRGEKKACSTKKKGTYSTVLAESTTFVLSVSTDSGQNYEKELHIEALDECSIIFSADHRNILPTLPVTLSWEVTDANKVWLNDEPVSPKAQKVVEILEDTTFVLVAEDAFGRKQEQIMVKTLPAPRVESILLPAPDINHSLSLSIKFPHFSIHPRVPKPKPVNIQVNSVTTKFPIFSLIAAPKRSFVPLPNYSLSKAFSYVLNQLKRML